LEQYGELRVPSVTVTFVPAPDDEPDNNRPHSCSGQETPARFRVGVDHDMERVESCLV